LAKYRIKLIEQLIQRLKQLEPTKPQPEEFYTVKEVDSPETDYFFVKM
jgi:hypothetical protein